MEHHRQRALIVSVTLHALIAAGVFFTTYYLAKKQEEQPKIIELVGGPPTDIYSTEAPRKGNKPITFDLPEVEEPLGENEEPEAADPKPAEVAPTPPAKEAPPTITPPKVTPKTQPKIVEKSKTAEAKPKTKAKLTEKKISYDEFAKKNPGLKNTAKTGKTGSKTGKANYKKVDVAGIAGGMVGGSLKSTGGGGGKALTREEQDRMDTYKSYLFQEIQRTASEDSAGINDQLMAKVTFDISAGGVISNPRIARSSGSREFDDFALNVFRRMPKLPPTPDRKAYTWTVNFTMDPNA